MNVGNTISTLRREKNIKQFVLAENWGIPQTYLSLIEKGIKTPSIQIIEKISFSLGIPYPVLFFLSIDKNDVSEGKEDVSDKFEPLLLSIVKEIFF